MTYRSSYRLITPPTSEPVTLSDLKSWAKIDTCDDNANLNLMISAAREAAEKYMRRAIISQTATLTLDLPNNGEANLLGDGVYDLPVTALYGALPSTIELPYAPVKSITSVETYNTANTSAAFAPSNYFLDSAGGRLVLNNNASWPSNMRERASVVITYVAGWGNSSEVPASIKTAIMMHAQIMYDSRIICEMPEACKSLLNQHKKYA